MGSKQVSVLCREVVPILEGPLSEVPMYLSNAASGNDYTSVSGEVTIDDDTTRQCISVTITTDSYTESRECFTFSITLKNTVANLTVDPDETSICIIDKGCELPLLLLSPCSSVS